MVEITVGEISPDGRFSDQGGMVEERDPRKKKPSESGEEDQKIREPRIRQTRVDAGNAFFEI